jgi:small-conductance mechanosensitive channel
VTTNYRSVNPRLSVELRVEVARDADVNRTEQLLTEIAKSATGIPGVRPDPAPTVRFVPGAMRRSLGFTLYYAVDPTADAVLVQSELRKRVFARLLAEHVALPSPAVVVSVGEAKAAP